MSERRELMQRALVIEVYRLESDALGAPRGSYGWVEDDSQEFVSVHWLPPKTGISSGVRLADLQRHGELVIPMKLFTDAASMEREAEAQEQLGRANELVSDLSRKHLRQKERAEQAETELAAAQERVKEQAREIERTEEARHAYEKERDWLEDRLAQAEQTISSLRGALEEAADDLGKASNQFKGMKPDGQNWRIFAVKEAKARAVLQDEAERS